MISDLGRTEIHEAICATSEQIAELLRRTPDGSAKVPKSDWTVAGTAAHLVAHLRLDRHLLAGASSPFTARESFFRDGAAHSAVNDRLLADFPERDPSRLAQLLAQESSSLLDAAVAGAGRDVRYHFMPVDADTFLCLVLLHELCHGYDIGRAIGRGFLIDPDHARLAIRGIAMSMPDFVDPSAARGLRACVELRIRGGSRMFVHFDEERVRVDGVLPQRVHCHVSADPVAFLLVAMGRRSQWPEIARGRLVAWGRKPMLPLRLTKLFPSPG